MYVNKLHTGHLQSGRKLGSWTRGHERHWTWQLVIYNFKGQARTNVYVKVGKHCRALASMTFVMFLSFHSGFLKNVFL